MSDYIKNIRKLIGNNPLRSVAAACIIENALGEILLQHRSDTKDFGTPGGSVELDETIIEGLMREVKEETGITLKKPTLFGIYSGKNQAFHYPNGDVTYYVVFVFYEKLSEEIKLSLNDESLSLKFYSRDNLPINLTKTDNEWIKKWQSSDYEFTLK